MPTEYTIEFANRKCTTTLRGLAILIIMIGHVGVSGFNCRYFNPFGGIGVAMFLFLSGFGLAESFKKNGLDGFWKKKVLRIAIPYLIWIPIYHILIRVSPLGSINHLEIIPRYWFIEYLFILYIIFYITFRFFKEKALVTIAILGVFSFVWLNNLRAEQSFSFLCGLLFSNYKSQISNWGNIKSMHISLLLITIGLTALLIKQTPALKEYDLESKIICFLNLMTKLSVASGIILFFVYRLPKGDTFFLSIGNISYELYLVHVPFFMVITGKTSYLTLFFIQSFITAYFLSFLTKATNNVINSHG